MTDFEGRSTLPRRAQRGMVEILPVGVPLSSHRQAESECSVPVGGGSARVLHRQVPKPPSGRQPATSRARKSFAAHAFAPRAASPGLDARPQIESRPARCRDPFHRFQPHLTKSDSPRHHLRQDFGSNR